MSENYTYNTTTGLIVPDTSEVQQDVENEFLSAFGSDLDLTPSTPQGRLIEMETLARQNTIGLCALVANQINIDYATGQYLDAIGDFYGVTRNGATSTRVLATLTGVAGTVIAASSLAKTDAGDQFYLENSVTIPVGGLITAYFLSSELGAIPCVTGTMTTIISQTIGWETISNPVAAEIGSEVESDFYYRKRIKAARFTGISLIQSISGALQLVDNLQSSFVYDNGTASAITYDGVSIPAHSILVIADGGTDADVAQAIFNKKSSGSGYTSITGQSVTVNVQDGAYGVSYPVTFNRPEVLEMDISITVKNVNYTMPDLTTAVQNAIIAWANGEVQGVDGLKIGQNVSPFEIGAAVSAQIPEIYVSNCLICETGGTPAATELSCTVSQIYAVETANITVTVV